jgi:soluble lytic murein transglycosylase-like protein
MAVHPATASAAPQITGAIRRAAQSTGISFEYLLTTAQIESNLNPSAQASTSSAKGLYQFIDQTWLGTMKQSGAALGLGRYADAIVRSRNGHYQVSDPTMRAAILRLRNDPQASAL